jgi:hypothetical protein
MSFGSLEQATPNAREAYSALFHLKRLVESAANTTRETERRTVGRAINRDHKDDPSAALRSATETLPSPRFEAAVSDARLKMETAVECLLSGRA